MTLEENYIPFPPVYVPGLEPVSIGLSPHQLMCVSSPPLEHTTVGSLHKTTSRWLYTSFYDRVDDVANGPGATLRQLTGPSVSAGGGVGGSSSSRSLAPAAPAGLGPRAAAWPGPARPAPAKLRWRTRCRWWPETSTRSGCLGEFILTL